MGPEIDITDKMSSRANESGFVFSFPLHFCVFVYCRRARLWRKDPTDDAFSIPCVRLWSTDDEKSLFICSVSAVAYEEDGDEEDHVIRM